MPDLRAFQEAPEVYRVLHRQAVLEGNFDKRVHASWGLIARGGESLPVLLSMLSDQSPEAREDAAGALAWLKEQSPDVVGALVSALDASEADEERDTILTALGALRSRDAIPALAAILRDASADEDTRYVAAEALGSIVRRRFDRQPDPIAAAVQWLDSRGR